MSLYAQFTTNPNLERDGILLEYGTASNGLPVTIRIARAGGANLAYAKRMEALVKPYRRQIQTETMDPKLVERLVRQVYAETVVLGWENVELPVLDAAGNQTGEMAMAEFTKDNCLRLFNDLPDLFADVQEQAQRAALFRAHVREADAGN